MKRKEKKYNIDIETADKVLQNVFAACDSAPNTTKLEEIESRSRQNLLSENIMIVISGVLFLAVFFVPLLFPHADAFVSADSHIKELKVSDHCMTQDSFSISFSGYALDVDLSYMEGADGRIVKAVRYDRETNTIVFPYYPEEYNIYVYDVKGRGIHLLLDPHD